MAKGLPQMELYHEVLCHVAVLLVYSEIVENSISETGWTTASGKVPMHMNRKIADSVQSHKIGSLYGYVLCFREREP